MANTKRLPISELAHSSLQERLNHWPHCLPKMGPACNDLLAYLEPQPRSQSDIKAFGLLCRLGTLVWPHGLVQLLSPGINPRYEITPKGRDYLTLLRHHNFLPQPPIPEPAQV